MAVFPLPLKVYFIFIYHLFAFVRPAIQLKAFDNQVVRALS